MHSLANILNVKNRLFVRFYFCWKREGTEMMNINIMTVHIKV